MSGKRFSSILCTPSSVLQFFRGMPRPRGALAAGVWARRSYYRAMRALHFVSREAFRGLTSTRMPSREGYGYAPVQKRGSALG